MSKQLFKGKPLSAMTWKLRGITFFVTYKDLLRIIWA